ncbi:TPA: helix-turn-helix transcriptional regulator, partial [Escherichia coli]
SRYNLMKKYNITERTAYRDLNMLSPFIEACGDGKYRLISARAGNQSKESLHKSLARLLDTRLISARAGNQSKESLHKSLARLLDTDAIFPERDEGFWQKLENRATEKHIRVQFHNPEHTIRDDLRKYLDVLEKAICNSNVCQIAYAGKTRIVHPYKLTNQRSIWYLLATEENKLKSFSLAKIKWLDIKKEKFAKSDEIQSLVSESCDPWVSDKTFDVVLFIYSNIAHYFLRRDLLPYQQLLHKHDNGITLSCKAAHKNQIVPLILYWLPNVEIIEPVWLKEAVLTMLGKYLTAENVS